MVYSFYLQFHVVVALLEEVRIPRRENSFTMGRAWIYILNYYLFIVATIRTCQEIQCLLYVGFLADPGEARGCSTNTSVIDKLIH